MKALHGVVKYVTAEVRGSTLTPEQRRALILFPVLVTHASLALGLRVTSAGYVRKVSGHGGAVAYDESVTLGLRPHEDDSLRLSAILLGAVPACYAVAELDGVPLPFVSTFPAMRLHGHLSARWPVRRTCGLVRRQTGPGTFTLAPCVLELEDGRECIPVTGDDDLLHVWLRDFLTLQPPPEGRPDPRRPF